MNDNDDDLQRRLQQGLQHHNAGRLEEAAQCYRQILRRRPRHAAALHFLGLVHYQRGDHERARRLLARAVKAAPDDARCHVSLALACEALGQYDEAHCHLASASSLAPHDAEIRFLLGNHYLARGQHRQAARQYHETIARDPHHAAAYNNLGKVHQAEGALPQARRCFEQAIAANPRFADAYFNLGEVLREQGELVAAQKALETVLRLEPDNAAAHCNLGTLLKDRGRVEEARACYQRALECDPRLRVARDNLLFVLSYHLLGTAEERLQAHRAWERHLGPRERLSFAPHRAAPETRLRIGYVSPDFKRHAACHFFEPLLAAHDRTQFEIFCYAEVARPDAVTRRLQDYGDHWCFTSGLDDAALARRIHADGIHILVDLAGHTTGNRLGAFTYRPAPVQATYLGYCATTGLSAMDYWIADGILLPADTPERASESLLRLPCCWIAYRPPPNCPEPREQRGRGEAVTFASFNQLAKYTPQVIETWTRILQALPQARLLLKNHQLRDQTLQEELRACFAAAGTDPRRLLLEPASPDYMARYNEVDIALDPFPRTGGVTTADALWMGVPVITLAGRFLIERQGLSMLAALGLEGELCARDPDEYVARAVALAQDPQRRQDLHRELRPRLQASPLGDGRGLAAALEAAYREMWHRYLVNRT